MSPSPSSNTATNGSPQKLLVRALAGEILPRPPVWFMRQAGRYLPEYRKIREKMENFLEFCYSPKQAAEVTLQPIDRFGLDAAIIFSDILVIPDALGRDVDFISGRGPVMPPLEKAADVSAISPDDLRRHLAPVYEAIGRVRERLPHETALIGFAGAPWTVASYMIEGGSSRDFGKLKSWAYGRPRELETLLGILVEAISEHLIAQIEAGADVVQLFDSWAGAVAASEFDRWVINPTAEIVKRVKAAHPKVPIIGFANKAGLMHDPYAQKTGIDGVSIDSSVPVSWAVATLQGQCAVQGNLDPQLLVAGGAGLVQEAETILETLGQGPFVFNLGHGIVPETPPEHVAQLAEFIRGWRR